MAIMPTPGGLADLYAANLIRFYHHRGREISEMLDTLVHQPLIRDILVLNELT